MRGHEHGGRLCEHPTKAACNKFRQEALGKCTQMTADKKVPTPCRLWATSLVDGKGVCTSHAGAILTRNLDTARIARKKAELDLRIDAYMAHSASYPSVWDSMAGVSA